MYYVIIPAYQPDQKLLELLNAIKHRLDCKIIVVDDGSIGPAQVIIEQASSYAIVLHHEHNLGKGQALKTAFQYIKEHEPNSVIVTADADGQHAIEDIDRVARAAMNLPTHLVLGVRQFSKQVPFRSRFGNKLTRLLFRLQTGVKVSDTQTGLRAFHSKLLPFMLEIEGQRYEYEMNMLTQASQQYLITEIPIQTIYIDDNASSHFRPIKDGLLIYKNLFKFALASLGGFLIDYGAYVLLIACLATLPAGIHILIANSLARLTSSLSNYYLNKKLVFQSGQSFKSTGFGYLTLALALFICDTSLIYIFHQLFGFNLYVVKIAVGLTLFFFSWFVQKHIIFNERKALAHEMA